MSDQGEKFWLENPCQLFMNITLFPTQGMSLGGQLNALTRIALLAGAGMYFSGYKNWLVVSAISLATIVVLWLIGKSCKQKNQDAKSEGFSVSPTYMSGDFQQTVVAPTYAEEWQIPPPGYDIMYDDDVAYLVPPHQKNQDPRSYPYGQYLTNFNMLPDDEENMNYLAGGATHAREYANSAFVRNDLQFREEMSRLQKLKLARRFRHNCNDVVSPYQSY